MEYSKFIKLLSSKEKNYFDFKIVCKAFEEKNSIIHKAELAKDICAMANNGNIASYIIIGVGNDIKTFRSVTNTKLTEDNIQNFISKAIFPPPKIKVYEKIWKRVKPEHKNIKFVIIQIGPQARQAFRLNQDFINYKQKVCYRRNEVWIRRNATTDLATPEEVSLLVQGKSLQTKSEYFRNIEYKKLYRRKQINELLKDISLSVSEIGGSINKEKQLILPIHRTKYVLKILLFWESVDWKWLSAVMNNSWKYEHGFIVPILNNITKKMLPPWAEIKFKENWGWFSYLEDFSFDYKGKLIPINYEKFPTFILFLPKLFNSKKVKENLYNMIKFFENDDEMREKIKLSKSTINRNLKKWLTSGWHFQSGNVHYIGVEPSKSKLKANEFFDKKMGIVLKIEKNSTYINMANTILNLSKR